MSSVMGLGMVLARRRLRRKPQAVLAVGLLMTTLVLYAAAAVTNAAALQSERLHERYQGPWQARQDITVGDRGLTIIAAAPTGQTAPGTTEAPRDGEMLVSPGVRQLLEGGSGRELLEARLPWTTTGVVAPEGLLSDDELVAVVGLPSEQLTGLRTGQQPVTPSPPVPPPLLGVLSVLVLVPGLLLLATCARVDLRRREKVFATLGLVGASTRQLRRIAVGEAVVASLPISLAGLAVGRLLEPLFARTAPGRHFPADALTPAPWALVAIVAATTLFSAVATAAVARALPSSGPVRRRPRATGQSLSLWRLLPAGSGAGLLLAAAANAGRLPEQVLALAELTALGLVLVGLPVAAPVLVQRAATVLGRLDRLPAGALLGLRRLQREPAAGSRAITGLVLATFVFGFVSVIDFAAPSRGLPDADLFISPGGRPSSELFQAVARVDGVDAVAPVSYGRTAQDRVLVTSCRGAQDLLDVRVVTGRCAEGAVLVRSDAVAGPGTALAVQAYGERFTGSVSGTFEGLGEDPFVDVVLTLPTASLASRPQTDVRVRTDGSPSTDLAVMRAAATALPLAPAGPPDVVSSNVPQAAAAGAAVTLVLAAGLVFALVGVAVTLGEAVLARGPVLSLLSAVGMGPRGARAMSATEVSVPLAVLSLPTLVLGSGLAYLAGRLLDGDVVVPWPRILTATLAVLALAVVTFAATVRAVRAVPAAGVLRQDAL